jgi:hypothetical protein
MTQTNPHHTPSLLFPPFPIGKNLWRPQIHSQPKALHHVKFAMPPKSELIHQRKVTRVVKGAIAGGFHVSTVKVDKDGAIVLYSNTQEREECEEPRLPLKANEWDEVLKK